MKNKYFCRKDTCYIKLENRKKQVVAVTKIDKSDLEKVLEYRWCLTTSLGAQKCAFNFKHKRLHQFLMGKKDGLEIDHINRDPLDNRRVNLRHVTHLQNSWNKKKRGSVFFSKDRGKWRASCGVNNKVIQIGSFTTKREADVALTKYLSTNNLFA